MLVRTREERQRVSAGIAGVGLTSGEGRDAGGGAKPGRVGDDWKLMLLEAGDL